MILVTGSTGTFGSHVIKELQGQKIKFRAAAQEIKKFEQLFDKNIDFAEFNWADPNSVKGLFDSITEIYLVSPPNANLFHEQILPFLDTAKEKGVKFIVVSTVFGTDANKEGSLYKTELAVQNSGIDYCIVRPNFIFQNFINYDLEAVKNGSIYLPSGAGKTSYIDVRDVASVIVEILKHPENYSGKIYNLTGIEALSHETAAQIFTKVLGMEIKNIDPTEEEYKNMLTGFKLPNATVDFMAMLYSFIKAGYFENVTNDFGNITGRKPKTFEDFVQDYKTIFINN